MLLLSLYSYTVPVAQAFVKEYEKWPLFHTGDGRRTQQNLDEFDDARETVASLSAEYRAAEHRDFVSALQPLLLIPTCLQGSAAALQATVCGTVFPHAPQHCKRRSVALSFSVHGHLRCPSCTAELVC